MEPYSNDPRAGGSVPPPPSPTQWGGPGGQGVQGTPMWQGANPGTPQYSAIAPAPAPAMVDQGPKWPALRTIASVLKIVAWIEGVLGVIAALGTGVSLAATIGGSGFLLALFLLVAVAVEFLLIYAASEIIMLFINIEKNTRPR